MYLYIQMQYVRIVVGDGKSSIFIHAERVSGLAVTKFG